MNDAEHANPAPNAARFPELTDGSADGWKAFFNNREVDFFPSFIGLQLEDVRTDYARMRLPHRPQLNQPAGVMHGGAITTLIDTVVVPAIAQGYDTPPAMFTVHLGINFLSTLVGADAVGEGWIVKRGYKTLFLMSEVRNGDTGELVATGELVYQVKRLPAAD